MRVRSCWAIAAVPAAVAGLLLPAASAAEVAPATGIAWGACSRQDAPAGMQCATIGVPVDWAEPGGRKITLDLARLPATRPAGRIGTVLAVPGGPGGSGIADLIRGAGAFTALRDRFDVVTLDPRNTAFRSELPESCYTSGPWLFLPETKREYDVLVRTNQQSAQRCRQADQEFFDHLDSASAARDMDAIRTASGERQLSFIATSYGGRPAVDYARMFPGRVRAMFMDGTSNPVSDHAAEDRQKYPLIEQQFARFVDWCASTAQCALHGEDAGAVWRKLVTDADRAPIPVSGQPPQAAYTGFDLKRATGPYLQSPHVAPPGQTSDTDQPGYVIIARAIDKARHGDASDFAKAVLQVFGTAKLPAVPGALVTECLDGHGYDDHQQYRESRRRGRALSPNFAGHWQWHALGCTGWPAPVSNPPRPLPSDAGLPPMLGAGTWSDSVGLDDLMRQVPGSVAIRFDGQGHGLYLSGRQCVIGHANRYLIELAPPPAGTVCSPS